MKSMEFCHALNMLGRQRKGSKDLGLVATFTHVYESKESLAIL